MRLIEATNIYGETVWINPKSIGSVQPDYKDRGVFIYIGTGGVSVSYDEWDRILDEELDK